MYRYFVQIELDKNQRNPSVYAALSDFCIIITRASILRTIPVAFIIYNNLLALQSPTVSICKQGDLYFIYVL